MTRCVVRRPLELGVDIAVLPRRLPRRYPDHPLVLTHLGQIRGLRPGISFEGFRVGFKDDCLADISNTSRSPSGQHPTFSGRNELIRRDRFGAGKETYDRCADCIPACNRYTYCISTTDCINTYDRCIPPSHQPACSRRSRRRNPKP